MPGMNANAIWRIGSERYLATNPHSNAHKRATKAHQTGDAQGTFGYGLITEGRTVRAAKGQQGRDRAGRYGRDRTDAVSPVRALGSRGIPARASR
jgi:hypothetical protein